MGLRPQLLLVALTLLLLPWAGCNYVQEMEDVLRTNQKKAVVDQAKLITHFVAQRLVNPPVPGQRFYTPIRYQPVQVDGYDDDWQSHVVTELAPILPRHNPQNVYLQKALYQDRLYLFIKIFSPQLHYYQPGQPYKLSDYIEFNLKDLSTTKQWLVFTSGSGPLQIFETTTNHKLLRPNDNIQAWWEETSDGYQIEVSIPQTELLQTFDINVYLADNHNKLAQRRFSTQANGKRSYWLKPIADLSQDITPYRTLNQDVVVIDPEGWPLTEQKDWLTESVTASERTPPQGLINTGLSRLYRALINRLTPSNSQRLWPLTTLELSSAQDRIDISSLSSDPESTHASWYQLPDQPQSALLVIQPIIQNSRVIAYVLLSQTGEGLFSLTNEALRRVTHRTVLVLLFVLIVLIAFASLLSWRIRKLNLAIEVATDQEGIHSDFKPSKQRDEVGELSRSFNTLLLRTKQHTDYLATLNSKLAHELRTPLSIVKSSLELVKPEPNSEVYQQRAETGVERLRQILSSMSEASRVEQTIQQSDFKGFDLSQWLLELSQAYADTYPEHLFKCQRNCQTAWAWGSPELLAQMMDKLIDNARSFAPNGSEIHLQLYQQNQQNIIEVSNYGPILPVEIEGQLFDSLVTQRQSQGNEPPHLGLGLFIVRLIAHAHNGRVAARNLPNAQGVVFRVELPISRNPD